MESRSRTSGEQFSILLEFMESHGDLTKPQPGAQGRLRAERLWQELANILNSLGGGVSKTPDKWKKVWADWKTKTKKKAVAIKRHASGTGGGPSSQQTLTVFEERQLAMMGILAVEGQTGIEEQGFNMPPQSSAAPPPSPAPPAPSSPQPSTSRQPPSAPFSPQPSTSRQPPPAPFSPQPSTSRQPPPAPFSPQLSTSRQPPRALVPQPPVSPATPPSTRQRQPPRASAPQPPVSPITPPSSRQRQPPIVPSPNSPLRLNRRRRRAPTPFDRATSEFVTIERARLRLEEMRERNLHERESRRIEVDIQHNDLLLRFADIADRWLNHFLRMD